jgi:carbonic anhydrase
MSILDAILKKNQEFVKTYQNPDLKRGDIPSQKLAVLTCIDARLDGVLQEAMGLQRGDAVFIKTAGNNLNYGEMRSVLTAIYKYDIKTLLVVGHEDCGMGWWGETELRKIMLERGIKKEALEEYDNIEMWLGCFTDARQNVISTIEKLRAYSLTPADLEIRGVYFSLSSGHIEPVL